MKGIKIEKLTKEEISERGIENWPIWEKEVSKFPWTYEAEEECLILEGDVIVTTDEEEVSLKAGDFVTFSSGLVCSWDIKKEVRKLYNFPS